MASWRTERTRAIKRTLAAEFGKANVSVRQGKGTASNWILVRVKVAEKAPQGRNWWKQEWAVCDRVRRAIAKSRIQLSQYATESAAA